MIDDCPFCGTQIAPDDIWGDTCLGGYVRWVFCPECGAQGPQARSRAHGQDTDKTDAASVEKWNCRIVGDRP